MRPRPHGVQLGPEGEVEDDVMLVTTHYTIEVQLELCEVEISRGQGKLIEWTIQEYNYRNFGITVTIHVACFMETKFGNKRHVHMYMYMVCTCTVVIVAIHLLEV